MKPAHTLTVAFLIAIAVAHLLRLFFGWRVEVGQTAVPMWPSVLAILLTLALALALWRETREAKT